MSLLAIAIFQSILQRLSGRYREQAKAYIGPAVLQLLGFAAAANQVIGGDPVHQAFVTLDVKRQHAVAVQRARGARLFFQAIDLITATQSNVDFLLASIGVAPEHFGLAVTGPGGPVIRRGGRLKQVQLRATTQQCQRRNDDQAFHPCSSTDDARRQP
ncbi:hypothetical protein EMIT0347P_30527 [Pseudomonas sp. IT-347P]